MSEHPADFELLWNLARNRSPRFASDAFGHADLRLNESPSRVPEAGAPLNAVMFADNGGDAIYSWLEVPGLSPSDWPVVMTVAPAYGANFVVGATIREFLSLGCRVGYLALEQLAYDYDGFVEDLERQEFWPDAPQEQKDDLNFLSRALELQPWNSPRERLNELKTRFESAFEFKLQ